MQFDESPRGRKSADAALEEWVARYGDDLLRVCFLQLEDYALAEDALQESFIRAYRAYDRFEGRSSVRTWLTAIAINVCRDMRRSARRRPTVSIEALAELPAPDSGNTGDYTVSRAVMGLPANMREVIVMHELQGMKLREIAEARRLPLATVASRLRRGKERLRRELEGWYFEEE